jgi:glycerol kinase
MCRDLAPAGPVLLRCASVGTPASFCIDAGPALCYWTSTNPLTLMEQFILALDQGTTSSRAVLFDHAGAIRSMAQREFAQRYPQPGWVEHDPDEIWATQVGVLAEAAALGGVSLNQIAALGITNQRETTVVWDRRTGQPIHPAIV